MKDFFDLQMSLLFTRTKSGIIDCNKSLKDDNSCLLLFYFCNISGIGITITPAIKALDISVNMPVTFRNQTKGLLGNYNNDPSDDFTLPNGTVLPSNITDRQKFVHFGIHCKLYILSFHFLL